MWQLTDREAGGEADPVGLVMGPDQLLPHVVHRHDEHGVGKALVDDHQHNGHRPHCCLGQAIIHITCTGRHHKNKVYMLRL